ncbi:MAG: HPr family phosphocarrier protein [Lachnospiraceae bacterium]|nr:HPr family phosphocarrier protein [Lachnospiraceae bacterium]
MKSFNIKLGTVEEIKEFVNEIGKIEGDFDLISGRYTIDAKSIVGILSLDLGNILQLKVNAKTGTDLTGIAKYCV